MCFQNRLPLASLPRIPWWIARRIGRSAAQMPREALSLSAGPVTSAREATARSGMLGMGRIDAASLAYERSVLATNPAAAREHSNICDSITNWCLALVCRQDPARLPAASTALASAGETRQCFRECLIARQLPSGWERASLRTMASAKKPQFGVHLAADYGPKRSNSNRLAGSCLTSFLAQKSLPRGRFTW
jgi:hypothetical protein